MQLFIKLASLYLEASIQRRNLWCAFQYLLVSSVDPPCEWHINTGSIVSDI